MDHYNRGRLSLSDEGYNEIMVKISENEWKVGEKLPSESQLCKMFGVSRTSVRAALQNLQGRGIIVTMQGVGSFVHKTPNEQNVPGVDITSDISSDEFKDFFEFRQAIEFKAIDAFVKKATLQEEEHLRELVEQMKEAAAGNDKKTFAMLDFDFHMTIIKGAKNSFLDSAMNTNKDIFFHYMSEIIRLTRKPLNVLAEEHEQLYSLLKTKKPKQAREHLYNDNTYYHVAYFSPETEKKAVERVPDEE